MLTGLRSLVRRIAALRDPRPYTLEEWIARHREVVRRDVDRILPYIPEDGIFLDVGANVGLFTEAVLEQRPGATAILFEPVERYHRLCTERLGDRPNVTIHHLALSDADEERTIYKPKHNYGGNSVVTEIMFDRREVAEVRPDTVMEEETIRCRRFEGFSLEHGIDAVDFIKTDTEGFDYAVLRGLLPFLERTSKLPVILSELLEESFHPHGAQQREVVDRIAALGYDPIDMSQMRSKVEDFLFVPSGHNQPAGRREA